MKITPNLHTLSNTKHKTNDEIKSAKAHCVV